jgi:hypothetical protein
MRAVFVLLVLLAACQSEDGGYAAGDLKCMSEETLCEDACRTKDRTTGGSGDYAQCLDNCRASNNPRCR